MAQVEKSISQRFNADPSPHYFETRYGGGFYPYATDDASNSGSTGISPRGVFTPRDMKRWTDAGIPLAVTVFKWAKPDAKAWAPETAYRNGKYYFYVPVGGDKMGVAVADHRKDLSRTRALTRWWTRRDENAGVEPIDPAVLAVKDGQSCLYFGTRVPKGVQR